MKKTPSQCQYCGHDKFEKLIIVPLRYPCTKKGVLIKSYIKKPKGNLEVWGNEIGDGFEPVFCIKCGKRADEKTDGIIPFGLKAYYEEWVK